MAYKASNDRMLFITASLLTIFGLVMVYSASFVIAASKHGVSYYYFLRQLGFGAAGYLLMIALMNVDYHVWQKEKILRLLLLLSAGSLVFVLLQPKVNGAHRWLSIGPFSFQPSEFAKLAVLLFVAAYLHKHGPEINVLRRLVVPLLLVGLFAGLIGIEPDLGGAVCLAFISILLLFIGGLSWKYIGAVALASVPVLYLSIVRVPFRLDRVMSFLDPFHDPLGASWQISQSLTAVGSGGPWGLGLGASKQKLFFLPEAHSDFIFAVVGEELGLLGTCFICLAFLIILFRGVKIAFKAPDLFGYYLGLGITLMVVIQAFINISMVLALMPTKGIALPFISQGGSSLMLNLVSAGILLNISQYGERG